MLRDGKICPEPYSTVCLDASQQPVIFGCDAQVVGDKHHGHLAAITQLPQQLKNSHTCTVTSKLWIWFVNRSNTAGLQVPLQIITATDRLKVGRG